MSQTEKAAYYKALKEGGVKFEKHYREYSTEDLKAAYFKLTDSDVPLEPEPHPEPQHRHPDLPPKLPPPEVDPEAAAFYGFDVQPKVSATPSIPTSQANPTEMAGERLNTKPEDEPIRTDEAGRIWYQEEIRKPAFPKPRGRRILTNLETGVEKKTVRAGEYLETFEVAGTGPATVAEVKITLPSYQVGIYKDPRFPFRIHIYNEQQGFDLFEVHEFYGGPELVPAECKRIYVENVLCYDIRTTVRAIETEYRQLQLTGKVE